jgi:hypothetical protein
MPAVETQAIWWVFYCPYRSMQENCRGVRTVTLKAVNQFDNKSLKEV